MQVRFRATLEPFLDMAKKGVLARNIESIFLSATPEELTAGISWYDTARARALALSRGHSIPLERVIAVIAILSPGSRWERNIEDAERLITAWRKREPLPMVGVYGRRNRDKAIAALESETFVAENVLNPRTGPKVYAFYRCISGHHDHIVIDRHAKCAALLATENRDTVGTVKRSEVGPLTHAYRTVAHQHNIPPAHLQAVVWCAWRNQVHQAPLGPR